MPCHYPGLENRPLLGGLQRPVVLELHLAAIVEARAILIRCLHWGKAQSRAPECLGLEPLKNCTLCSWLWSEGLYVGEQLRLSTAELDWAGYVCLKETHQVLRESAPQNKLMLYREPSVNPRVPTETHTETCLNTISLWGCAVAGGLGPFPPFYCFLLVTLCLVVVGESRVNLLGPLLFSFLDGIYDIWRAYIQIKIGQRVLFFQSCCLLITVPARLLLNPSLRSIISGLSASLGELGWWVMCSVNSVLSLSHIALCRFVPAEVSTAAACITYPLLWPPGTAGCWAPTRGFSIVVWSLNYLGICNNYSAI